MSTADRTAATARNAMHAPVGIERHQYVVDRQHAGGKGGEDDGGKHASRHDDEDQRRRGRRHREHQALHDQLAGHSPPAGTKRQAHGNFRLSCQRARQHQVRDVRGGDQEHQAERRHDEHEQRHRRPLEREACGQRVDAHCLPAPYRTSAEVADAATPRTMHAATPRSTSGRRRPTTTSEGTSGSAHGSIPGKRARHRQRRPEVHEFLAGQRGVCARSTPTTSKR